MSTTTTLRTRFSIPIASAAANHGRPRALAMALAAIVVNAALPLSLHAQTCVAPETLTLPSNGTPFFYTTCDTEPPGLELCSGQFTTVGPSHIFSVFVTQGSTYVLTLGSSGAAGFDPHMVLAGGATCQSGDCVSSNNSISLHDQPTGPYLLYVTADQDNAPGSCGGFSLSLTGEPASDVIFQNGFD